MEQRLELPDPVNHHWEQRSIVISSESDQEQYLKNAWYTKKCNKASFLYCNQKLGRSLGMRLHNHWTTSSSYLLHIVNRNSLVLRPPPSFSSFILQAGQMTGNEASMECSLVPGNIMLWHLISHVRTCTRIMFCSRQWQTLHGSWPAYIAYLKIYSWTYVEISCALSKLTVCLLSSHVKWEWLVATLSKLLLSWFCDVHFFSSEAILPLVEDAFAHPVPPLPERNSELQVRTLGALFIHLLAQNSWVKVT